MKNDNFDDILTEALKEYVKDKEAQSSDLPKVEFSKRHEKNMEKLFKSVADGTFEESEEKDIHEHVNVGLKNTRSLYIKPVKVAVFVLLGLVVSLAIAPTMSAWRKEELGLYGDNMDEYAWVLRNDITEIHEGANEDFEKYKDMFGYLPEGFKITKVISNRFGMYLEFKNIEIDNRFEVKAVEKINGALDIDDNDYKKRNIGNFSVSHIEKNGENIVIWTNDEVEYQLYGDIKWDEIEKIIINIKYKEFEKSF